MSPYSPQHDYASTPFPDNEAELIEQLRNGEEDAFSALLQRYHTGLVRIAMMYVDSRPIAEDVVQETWLAVLQGLNKFEGRSSLRTWIFSILLNRAKTRAMRENRSVAFSALADDEVEADEPAVDPSRFRPADHQRWPHHWETAPQSWDNIPEARLLSNETLRVIQTAIQSLAGNQREVIMLRDVEGWDADEVCNVLAISATNQRVLLHRARSAVRQVLEDYLNRTT